MKSILKTCIMLLSVLFFATSFAATNPNAAFNPTPPTTGPGAITTQQAKFTPAQSKQVEQIVHEYLLSNPQILIQMSEALQKQQMTKMERKAKSAISKHAHQIFDDPNSPIAGNPKGTVTLVEFFDYQCAHCKAMGSIIKNLIAKNKNLRVVFKEFPIFGPNSTYASEAALASTKQGKYLAFHNALLKAKQQLSKSEVMSIAKTVTLNVTTLQKDMANKTFSTQIKANQKLAQDLGLIGTPAFVVSNQDGTQTFFYPGATDEATLQNLINKAKS